MFSRGMQVACAGLVVLGSMMMLSTQTHAEADEGVFGYWKTFDTDTGKVQSVVRLWEDKGKLVGKLLKSFPKAGKPVRETCTECTGAQKDKPMNGLIFLWGLERDKEKANKWLGGKVLNPDDGKVYNVEVELGEDKKTLNVYGYINLLVKVGGTNVWKRATPDEAK